MFNVINCYIDLGFGAPNCTSYALLHNVALMTTVIRGCENDEIPPSPLIVKFSRGLLICNQLSVKDEVFCTCTFFLILNNMIKLYFMIILYI